VRRFFLDDVLQQDITISGPDAKHIGQVLRLEPGDEILVVGKDGEVGRALLRQVKTTLVEASLLEKINERHEPLIEVWLAQGLPKADKMEYIVQKAVELGACGIIPMVARFSTVQYDETKRRTRVERWQKIAQEAAKQCGRDRVSVIAPVQTLDEILSAVDPETAVIMLYEGDARQGLKEILSNLTARSYLLLIGPEGGFSPAEVELCQSHSAHIATLGPRILRTETAALAAVAILMYQNGDLG